MRVGEPDSAATWSHQWTSNKKKKGKTSTENGWLWKVKTPNTETLINRHLKCTALRIKWQHLCQLYMKI